MSRNFWRPLLRNAGVLSQEYLEELDDEIYRIIASEIFPDFGEDKCWLEKDLNSTIQNDPTLFLNFLENLLANFSRIRQCTLSVLQTYFEPLELPFSVKWDFLKDENLFQHDQLKEHLRSILVDPSYPLESKVSRNIKKFLDRDFSASSSNGGFVGLLGRHALFQKSSLSSEKPNIQAIFEDSKIFEKLRVAAQRDLEDYALLKRLNFVLETRELFSVGEWKLLAEKLLSILASTSITYYSDIFELYFFALMKKSGIEIELIPPQMFGAKSISTCDYKLGTRVCADAKCIIGDSVQLTNISEWLTKVGKQVKSTKDWMGVEFGGAVIGVRDKEFPFLNQLREFSNSDIPDEPRIYEMGRLIVELYAEFRRHVSISPENIKFVIFFYLPTAEKPTVSIDEGKISIPNQKEVMFLLSTMYASDDEIDSIKEIFSDVAPYLFKFDNMLRPIF